MSRNLHRTPKEKSQARKEQMLLRTLSVVPNIKSVPNTRKSQKATGTASLMNNHEKSILAPLVSLSIAYEWLISSVNKFASGNFVSGFASQMRQAVPDLQYKFYGHLLQTIAIPHARLIGTVVEYGEVLVGLAFVLLAISFWQNRAWKAVVVAGAVAAVLGALMSLNFFFFQGGAFFLNPAAPFDEGIPIDFIFVLLHASIAIYLFKRLKNFSIKS